MIDIIMTEDSQVDHLHKFEQVYKELEEDIRTTYKKFKVKDSENRLRDFVRNILPYMDDISCNNVDAFLYKYKKVNVVNGVRLSKLLKESNNVENLRAVWKYLQTLYVLAYNVEETYGLVDEEKENENYNSMVQNLEQVNYTAFLQNFINSGELSRASRVETTVKTTVETTTDNPSVDEEEAEDEDEDNNENNESNNTGGDDELPDFLKNSMIGSLAKELSEEIKPEEFGDISNPGDLLNNLFSGGADGKLGGIIGKVVNKLGTKLNSGELDEKKLMGEAGGLVQNLGLFQNMGGMGGLMAGMMGSMGGMPPMPPSQSAETNEETPNSETESKKKKKKRRRKKKKKKSAE